MPRTVRELVWAARGRLYSEWEQVAEVWAIIAEANRDRSKRVRPYTSHDLFRRPGTKRPSRGNALTGAAFRSMKPLFIKKKD